MKLGRTCAAAVALGALALPLTATASWADTAQEQEPTRDTSVRPAPSEASDTKAPAAEQSPIDEKRREAAERESQVEQRPEGAPETGGGPAEWDATPAYVAGGAAAVAVAGVGTVLVLRRRHAGQQ